MPKLCISRHLKALFGALCLSLLTSATPALAQTYVDFDMEWDAVSASDLAGYILHWGYSSGNYHSSVNVGSSTSYTLSSAVRGKTYYFAVTAYDLAGNESGFSNEISKTIAAPPADDVDADGIPNDSDTDDDNDGLSDAEEASRGTDPLDWDSDNDGVSDGQEVTDGTNPLDRGSHVRRLGKTICGLWNSFLGMWNIFEHLNFSNTTARIFTRVNNIQGQEVDAFMFDVSGGTQQDILIHDNTNENGLSDSYGKVCSSYNGNDGDVRGTMVYYKQDLNPGAAAGAFQYALALPISMGLVGEQVVSFNNLQASWAAEDLLNLVANWISVTNRSPEEGSGRLIFYGLDGQEVGNATVTLAGGQREDVSGHQFGSTQVGHVRWIPDDENLYELKNLRYLYDNLGSVNSFDTAFQIDGAPGTGSLLTMPLDTVGRSAILEISNVTASTITVDVKIYHATGGLLSSISQELRAYETRHLITDEILVNGRGIATVKGSAVGSVFAVAMQYDRNPDYSVNYMYGVSGQEAIGTVLRSSYNTFLTQVSELWLSNPHDSEITVQLSMTRSDGTSLVSGHSVSVPAHGLEVVNLNDWESEDHYGVVTVTPDTLAPVTWVKRRKAGDFVIPTHAME